MPLGEAVVYLKRAVRRRFGQDVTVRLVESTTEPGPFPVIIINGKVFSRGTLSYQAIIQELRNLSTLPR